MKGPEAPFGPARIAAAPGLVFARPNVETNQTGGTSVNPALVQILDQESELTKMMGSWWRLWMMSVLVFLLAPLGSSPASGVFSPIGGARVMP